MGRVTLCEVRGLLVDTIEKLSGEDGAEWAERLKSTLRKDDLLRRITEVAVSATNQCDKEVHRQRPHQVGQCGLHERQLQAFPEQD